MRRSRTRSKTTTPADSCAHRVRICANKVVACLRCSTPLLTIRPQDARQFTSAQHFDQLEGLAVAIPWGFESPLPHHSIRPALAPSRFGFASRDTGLRATLFESPKESAADVSVRWQQDCHPHFRHIMLRSGGTFYFALATETTEGRSCAHCRGTRSTWLTCRVPGPPRAQFFARNGTHSRGN